VSQFRAKVENDITTISHFYTAGVKDVSQLMNNGADSHEWCVVSAEHCTYCTCDRSQSSSTSYAVASTLCSKKV